MLAYQRHPLSALLPALTADEIEGLRTSIVALGVIDPITLYEGQVLDGWNRYTLADEQQVPCPHVELPEGLDPVDFVRSKTRGRNMTQGQLALLEVSLHEWRGTGRPEKGAPGAPFSVAQMAANAQVSERTIHQAKAVAQAAEAVKEAVKGGKLSVKRGAEIAKLPAEEQAAAVAAPKVAPPEMVAPPPPEDPGFQSPMELAEEQEAEIRRLAERLASAEADDKAAELIKLRTMLQVSERRQGELMADAARYQSELRTASNTLRQLCDVLDLVDTRRLVSAVKALAAQVKAQAQD